MQIMGESTMAHVLHVESKGLCVSARLHGVGIWRSMVLKKAEAREQRTASLPQKRWKTGGTAMPTPTG